MKKGLIILGVVAVLLVAALAALVYWLQLQLEEAKNKNRTAAASAARWAGRMTDQELDKEREDFLAETALLKEQKTATDEKEST